MNKMRETSCRGGMTPRTPVVLGFQSNFIKKCMTFAHWVSCPPKASLSTALGFALHNAWGVTRFYGLSQPSGVKHAGKSAGQKSTKIHIRQKLSGRTNAMAGMRGNDSAGFPELPPGLCRDMLRISSVLFMLQQLHGLAK